MTIHGSHCLPSSVVKPSGSPLIVTRVNSLSRSVSFSPETSYRLPSEKITTSPPNRSVLAMAYFRPVPKNPMAVSESLTDTPSSFYEVNVEDARVRKKTR